MNYRKTSNRMPGFEYKPASDTGWVVYDSCNRSRGFYYRSFTVFM